MKKIDGSWFEFQHMFDTEGKYWNKECLCFAKEQWIAKIEEMANLGFEYLVLMASALDGKTFFKSDNFNSFELACPNALEVLLSTADKYNLKVFIGNDFVGDWSNAKKMIIDPELIKKRDSLSAEIAEKYGFHKSFYGWYLPNEAEMAPYYSQEFITYVNHNAKFFDSLTPGKKKLIAPYGTCKTCVNDTLIKQIDSLNVDVIAYQDEVGVRKSRIEDTKIWFERLNRAHEKVGKAQIWADVEIFQFEGDVYKSALIPSTFDSISQQIDNVAPFVEKILVYQYLGMMSDKHSIAKVGHPGSEKLYQDYYNWLKQN
ncbi:MAG: DUF4434 domain-containing protein [Spirochaetales bacterium]|nr:DUF4434 domain-containing protein [Spirochaetales bacterium]